MADFLMNDRCAAGTGRFLEMLAAQLGTPFHELESLVARSRVPAVISSMCVVFAESEIVGLLAAGVCRRISSRACKRPSPRGLPP